VLRGWTQSPFEREGSVRAGLRAALCLEGARWDQADNEAERVIDECFRRMGVERPSWMDGQRNHVDRGDFCLRCGRPMADDAVTGGRLPLFCSDICATAALAARENDELILRNEVRKEAKRLVARESKPAKVCAQCGKLFHPAIPWGEGYRKQLYCSHNCANIAKEDKTTIACTTCGKTFSTKRSANSLYCSRVCKHAATFSKSCIVCGSSFDAKTRDALYCSRRCSVFIRDWRSGTRVPHRLGDLVFDYAFTAPITMARAARPAPMFLTAGLFDNLFREAA